MYKLIPEAFKGHERLVESFVENRSRLLRLVARFVRPHEIEDIVQETFVRSYVAARNQVIENPGAFMLRTARNLALNSLNRADNRLNRSMEEYAHDADFLICMDTPEEKCQAQQQFLALCEAVSRLPLHCRRAFILKKVYGLTQKEIAAHLGISQSTVKKHIAKGLLETAEHMRDSGYLIGGGDRAVHTDTTDEVQES